MFCHQSHEIIAFMVSLKKILSRLQMDEKKIFSVRKKQIWLSGEKKRKKRRKENVWKKEIFTVWCGKK